jgi:hypothetical protein
VTPARPAPDPRSLLTAAEAARAGIAPAATIRAWAQRGYLFAIGVDDRSGTQGGGHRSPLYRRRCLERLAAKRQREATIRRLTHRSARAHALASLNEDSTGQED